MEDCFEKYVRNVLTDALSPGVSVIDGNKQSRSLFVNSTTPQITPDIMICQGKQCVVVADVKYKDKPDASVDDWYQIISYTMALKVDSGVLIYSSETPRPPRKLQIGTKAVWIYYYTLSRQKTQEAALIDFMRALIAAA